MNKADFAFIVHSRDASDMKRKYILLRVLPNALINFITLRLKPILVSYIDGVKSIASGHELRGVIIGIPMNARQLLEHRSLALKRIIESVEFAKKLGATKVALGAMTSSLSKGGLDVIESVENVDITNGRTYTAKNICDYVQYYTNKLDLHRAKVGIAIVGAAGGIGSSVAITLCKLGYKNFTLIDLERKLGTLEKHIESLNYNHSDLSIKKSHKINSISNNKFVIAATSSPEIVIRSSDVEDGTIIINDAQPSDIDTNIIKSRKDVIVVEGGVLHSDGINCHFNFGLHHKNDIFSCLAEVILLAALNEPGHKSISELDHNYMKRLDEAANALGFKICPQNIYGIVNN